MRFRPRKDPDRRAGQCKRFTDCACSRTQAGFKFRVHRAGDLDLEAPLSGNDRTRLLQSHADAPVDTAQAAVQVEKAKV